MVERLKQAIEKARRERAAIGEQPAAAAAVQPARSSGAWAALPLIETPQDVLTRARVVTDSKSDLAHLPFDVMRTRILKACRENGWRRIGVTSSSKSCGKTFVSTNLAFSMVRNPDIRCVLLDFDLRRPALRSLLALEPAATLDAVMRGEAGLANVVVRVRQNLAIACSAPMAHGAELIQSPRTAEALARLQTDYAPDVMIFDMPPILAGDDVLSTLGLIDALILVAAAGSTTAHDIREAEQLFGGAVPFLGVVLNKVDPADAETPAYGYGKETESVA